MVQKIYQESLAKMSYWVLLLKPVHFDCVVVHGIVKYVSLRLSLWLLILHTVIWWPYFLICVKGLYTNSGALKPVSSLVTLIQKP